MHWISISHSHTGLVRDNNEDALLTCDERGIWLLADGMGGHEGGEVASRLACDVVAKELAERQLLSVAIQRAHDAILAHASHHTELTGMGTTLVAAQQSRHQLLLGWVGDSRIYLLRQGELTQLSIDHSFVQDMVLRGVLTPEEAHVHPQKHLLRQALGQASLRNLMVDTSVHLSQIHDVVLLCSDGVHDMLTLDELRQCLVSSTDIAQQSRVLHDRILLTDASDNFSFVLLHCRAGLRQPLRHKIASFFKRWRQ